MWQKSFSTDKPLEIESLGRDAYMIRRGITKAEDGYSYEERIVNGSVVAFFQSLNDRDIQINELRDAMVELANVVVE